MDSLTTYDKVQADGTHTVMTFKNDFLKECPNYMEVELCDLFQKHNIQKFLHNPVGPACKNPTYGYEAFWLNGNLLDPTSEEVKKIKHLGKFNTEFTNMIDSEDDVNDVTKSG